MDYLAKVGRIALDSRKTSCFPIGNPPASPQPNATDLSWQWQWPANLLSVGVAK